MIKLNSEGRIAQFYRYHYHHAPGRNLCPFFWQMLLAVAVFPITWTSYPFAARTYGDGKLASFLGRVFASVLCTLVLGAVGVLVGVVSLDPYGALDALWFSVKVIGGLAGAIALVVGIIGGSYWLRDRLDDVEVWQETKAIVRGRKESFMGRYCPKIEWR